MYFSRKLVENPTHIDVQKRNQRNVR